MKKHPFNIYPEAKPDDYTEIREDIRANGYDKKQPVVTYQGLILDGWNRQKACDELGIVPTYVEFRGTDIEAIQFMARSNKRRNLNSGQKATLAAEADEIVAKIQKDAKPGRPRKGEKTVQKIEPVMERKTDTKVAAIFGTNRTYVNQATKIRKEAPEIFEKVKNGTMTMQDANKAVRAIPKDPWSDDEVERRIRVEAGLSVISNAERDKNLIQWAEGKGLAVRIDRGTPYGNPFILGKDGDRNAVCENYEKHYLPFKPSIKKSELKGKVLICHCYPERCHGLSLI